MSKRVRIVTVALILVAAMAFTGCTTGSKGDSGKKDKETEVEETEETEATTTTTETSTEPTMDEVFEAYLRFQDNPSPEEPEFGNTIEEVEDEQLRAQAQALVDDGYEFVCTAESLWFNGAGYGFKVNNRLAFLINGFLVCKIEGKDQINRYMFAASEELCEKYLGYNRVATDGDIITYASERDDYGERKVTFDRSAGILTITDVIYNIGSGVG
ncbi:hypothetical protein SAMN02910456_02245 [Ruminococcaceae bacterium YRB3002]|nr:hypothetical protein SAMN02910456_02245 [Ruminococcaceae bacterium YRB3002]